MPALLLRSVDRAGLLLHWWALPWPWSQLALEVTPSALCALAALPALGAALAIHRTFRWVSLIRTGVINLALITLGYFLFGWLRSMLAAPRSSQLNDTFLLTLACLQLFFSFSTFLVAASLGCLPPRANCRA
jgi:hypothetical protein